MAKFEKGNKADQAKQFQPGQSGNLQGRTPDKGLTDAVVAELKAQAPGLDITKARAGEQLVNS